MQQNQLDEDDVILLGDLNADPNQFGALRSIPAMKWSVEGVPTNTRRTKTYDNLLFSGAYTTEYTGAWGVFDMEKELGLSLSDALQVSDHLPVWSEFSQWETASALQ
jgi:exonuclease III